MWTPIASLFLRDGTFLFASLLAAAPRHGHVLAGSASDPTTSAEVADDDHDLSPP